MIISALRTPGGKARSIKKLIPHFPQMNDYLEFREPMCGGLSLSLYYKTKHNLLFSASDLNYDLYCFWNELKNNPIQLECVISNFRENTTNGKELYNNIINRRKDNITEFQRAVDFYLINRMSFSGLADSGGFSQEAFDKRFTKSAIERIHIIDYLIKDFNFYCEDFSYLMNKGGEKVFVYCDPPYYSQTNSKLYGKNGDLHVGFDHIRFFETFKSIKHNALITYDDCDHIRSLYKEYKIKSIELQYSMNNVNSSNCKKGKEIIITNF
jgi:DNA adenine methylase